MSIINNADYKNENPDCLFSLDGLSARVIMALYRAEIKTISALRQTTDQALQRVRGIGAKGIEIINNAVPDRIRTFEGEAELLKAQRIKRHIDIDARRILRFMGYKDMKLSELIASDCRITGKRQARQLLTEYCLLYPEYIDDVIAHFEAMNDVHDKFYIFLKAVKTTSS